MLENPVRESETCSYLTYSLPLVAQTSVPLGQQLLLLEINGNDLKAKVRAKRLLKAGGGL